MEGADPLRVYLRRIGQTPLLTREGELELALQIEHGERRVLRVLLQTRVAADELRRMREGLAAGTIGIRSVAPRLDDDAEAGGDELPARARLVGVLEGLSATTTPDLERRVDLLRSLRFGMATLRPIERKVQELLLGLVRADAELAGLRARPVAGRRRVAAEIRARIAVLETSVGLTAGRHRDLHRELSEGRRMADRARGEFVRSNLRLVISIAKRYQHGGLALLDLIQEGNIGLMRGIEKYDPRHGHKLATYATWWIRQSVSRAVADQGRTIRIPVHVQESLRQLAHGAEAVRGRTGREGTVEEVADAAGLAADRSRLLVALARPAVPLEAPLGPDGDGSLADRIEDPDARAPDDGALQAEVARRTRRALDGLRPRERAILELRFGLDGAGERSLAEIGQVYSVTRERIRQIEAKALGRLRADAQELLGPLVEPTAE